MGMSTFSIKSTNNLMLKRFIPKNKIQLSNLSIQYRLPILIRLSVNSKANKNHYN